MSDVDFAQSDEAFEAEVAAAREAEAEPVEAHEEEQIEQPPEPPADPDREKLEKVARDKDGMARSERQKRREAEARAEALEARLAALESKKSDDLDFATIPPVDQDPIANIEAIRKLAERMTQEQKATQAQTAQQTQFQQINTRLQSYEADFKADHPDYDEAAAFFRDARKSELEEMGYAGQELMQALSNDLVGLAVRAMQSGKDPAEIAYNLAKKRGFGAEKPKPVDEPDKKLQAVERGLAASKSLSAVAKAGDGELTIEAINKLDGAAFDAALAKFKAQQRKAA